MGLSEGARHRLHILNKVDFVQKHIQEWQITGLYQAVPLRAEDASNAFLFQVRAHWPDFIFWYTHVSNEYTYLFFIESK